MSAKDLRFYSAHKAGCGWQPSHRSADGKPHRCNCGLYDILLIPLTSPQAPDSAFRPFVCHDRICAWSRSVQHGLARVDCDCGLSDLLARLGPSSDPALRRREAQMASKTAANPPGYQRY